MRTPEQACVGFACVPVSAGHEERQRRQGQGGRARAEGAKALAASVAASGSLALKTLYVPSAIENHAALVAACTSKGVEQK